MDDGQLLLAEDVAYLIVSKDFRIPLARTSLHAGRQDRPVIDVQCAEVDAWVGTGKTGLLSAGTEISMRRPIDVRKGKKLP